VSFAHTASTDNYNYERTGEAKPDLYTANIWTLAKLYLIFSI